MNSPANPEFHQTTFHIEQPQVEDALELATMHNQSWMDTYPNDDADVSYEYIKEIVARRLTEQGLTKRRDNIEHAKNDPTYFFRIAKNQSGNIVGFIDGFLKGDEYELAGLYTDKKTHGSGLAMQLWESYKQWVDPNKKIWITVATYNERAKRFYNKLGFNDIAHTERLYEGTHIPVIDMERLPEE